MFFLRLLEERSIKKSSVLSNQNSWKHFEHCMKYSKYSVNVYLLCKWLPCAWRKEALKKSYVQIVLILYISQLSTILECGKLYPWPFPYLIMIKWSLIKNSFFKKNPCDVCFSDISWKCSASFIHPSDVYRVLISLILC